MKIKNSIRILLAILAFFSIVLFSISSINAALPGIGLLGSEPIQNKTSGVFLMDRELYSNLSGGIPLSNYRVNNYLFGGEAIHFKVLALDLEGMENIEDVYFALTDSDYPVSTSGRKEVSCIYGEQPRNGSSITSANIRLGEEKFDYFNSEIMAIYDCDYVVENKETVYGTYWAGVEMIDANGKYEQMEEYEYWFLNPILALDTSSENSLNFGVRNFGERIYSDVIIVENSAETGAGVPLNMSISGIDLYNSEGQLVECEGTDKFLLKNIKYYAVNGAYNTQENNPNSDNEGYSPISYEDEAIIDNLQGNMLTLGAQMALMFRIDIPENCKGSFDSGIVKITGTEPANPNQKVILELPFSLETGEDTQLFRILPFLVFDPEGDDMFGDSSDRGYVLENEIIYTFVLAVNYKGMENTKDVYITVNGEKKVSCFKDSETEPFGWNFDQENRDEAAIRKTGLSFNPEIMAFYDCPYTVESSDEVYGGYFIDVKMLNNEGLEGGLDFPDSFFFNPIINLKVTSDNLNLGEVVAGQRIYTNPLAITTKSEDIEYVLRWMDISGEKFYNSLSESSNCKNISLSYFASSRDWVGGYYDTFNDPRADREGYVALPSNAGRVIIQKMGFFTWDRGSVLFSGGEMNLTFRLDIPEECTGNFSGEIDIIGSDYQDEYQKVIVPLTLDLTATPLDKNVSITFNGNISIISSPYSDQVILDPQMHYLFEGDKITSDNVTINMPSGIDKLAEGGVFVSVNDEIQAECILKEKISNTEAKFLCPLTIETPDSMYGDSLVKIEARTIYDTSDSLEIRSWFFNPMISIDFNPQNIIFIKSRGSNEEIYSNPFQVKNTAEANVSLSISLSGINYGRENCPLASIKYYAENKGYNTSSDPRADSEGYLSLSYGNRIEQSGDVIRINDTGRYYDGNVVYLGENMTLRFKLNTSQCGGNLDIGEIYLWGSTANYGFRWNGNTYAGSGHDLGAGIPISLINVNCITNLDCNDNNIWTEDACINPATINSTCQHLPIKCFSRSDCGIDGFVGGSFCVNDSKFGSYLSFNCISSGTSASYCTNKTEQKLIESCKFGCMSNTCILDSDNDGVPDNKDKCPRTRLPERFVLLSSHYGDIDGDKMFETVKKGKISNSNYSLNDTKGCSCKQILGIKPGRNIGEEMFGCTEGTIKDFIKKSNIKLK